jgi:hypothetical protein
VLLLLLLLFSLAKKFAIYPLQKEIDYLLRTNSLEYELNTDLTFREQETDVDTHIVPLLHEALAQSGIQATHMLIHDIVHQKFKYKKSKKILSAEEKENLMRRQHANNRSHEVMYKFINYCGKFSPTANTKYLQKRTQRAKGIAELQKAGDPQVRRHDSREWRHILTKWQYHLPEVSPERGTDSREILVYDIAGRSEEVDISDPFAYFLAFFPSIC